MMNNARTYKIYKHTSPDNKVYIGMTGQSLKKRWNNGNNYRNNKYFYRAIKKYWWDNFKHDILEKNLDYNNACEKEIYYIQKYNSTNPSYGYNLLLGGVIQDEKIREIMSKNNKKKQKVIRLVKGNSKETYILEVYNSIIECSKMLNCSKQRIESKLKLHKAQKPLYYYLIYRTPNFDNYGNLYFHESTLPVENFYKYSDELFYYLTEIWEGKDMIKVVKRYDQNIRKMDFAEWYENLYKELIENFKNGTSVS